MRHPFHHIKHAQRTFDHFHQNLHHTFVLVMCAIIGILWGSSQLFVTSTANWQWGNFVTPTFWEQSPSTGNVFYAFFGDGNPGSTAYTKLRNSSCIPTSIQHISGTTLSTPTQNTIYIVHSGTYTLSSPLHLPNCSVLVGRGNVTLRSNSHPINIDNKNHIILDNIFLDGQNNTLTGIAIHNSTNITINNSNVYNFSGMEYAAIAGTNANKHILLNKLSIFNGYVGVSFTSGEAHINNSIFFNLNVGIRINSYGIAIINNSVLFNNLLGVFGSQSTSYIHNSTLYNNGASIVQQQTTGIINDTKLYNNEYGISLDSGNITYFGTIQTFNNTQDYHYTTPSTIVAGTTVPLASRNPGTLITGSESFSQHWIVNPQNGNNLRLLGGSFGSGMRLPKRFAAIHPIRYIFGNKIPKQQQPIRYDAGILKQYGSATVDFDTHAYLGEKASILAPIDQDLVQTYFGSGSLYTQQRTENGCSLSSFVIKHLPPGNFSAYSFDDHTIYILTGGEYRSTASFGTNAFTFNGNCIALIGNNETLFTTTPALSNVLYANNKHNLIIENIRIDGTYVGNALPGGTSLVGIAFDNKTNNSTLYNVQTYNNAEYGIYLGLSTNNITIHNTQTYNNIIGGIYLHYASNYTTINNVQSYNNKLYGIWIANGSNKNSINNTQIYNNGKYGFFGDLTTAENIINNSIIYNNEEAGIYLKNSSGNIFNATKIYNNAKGIVTVYNSVGNSYYGSLELYNNTLGDFDGTNGQDTSLSPGLGGIFAYPGTISTQTPLSGCSYATNPNIYSGNSIFLLNTGCTNRGWTTSFFSPYNAYVGYHFGNNIPKQTVPKRYLSGGILVDVPLLYSPNRYIAEVTTIIDDIAEDIAFSSTGNFSPNSRYFGEVYTANTINTSLPIHVSFTPNTSSGYLLINGQRIGTPTTLHRGDTIQVAVLSLSGYNHTITGTVVLGSVSTSFSVTTKNHTITPHASSFAFAHLMNMETDIVSGSSTLISGLETGSYASLSLVPSSSLGRLEVYSGSSLLASGTHGLLVNNTNTLQVKVKSSSSYGSTITGYVHIGLGSGMFTVVTKGGDTTPPTRPTLTFPLSGELMFFVHFHWVASVDTGSGIHGYVYEIANTPTFSQIIHTGFMITTGTTGSPLPTFNKTSGRYYVRIQAKDFDGNVSPRSTTGEFRIYPVSNRTTKITITGAHLLSYYTSDIVTIKDIFTGLYLPVLASSNAIIYKNGEEEGSSTFVQNDDTLYLKSRSSNNYNKTTTGTLTIANRIVHFVITTKASKATGCTLNEQDRTTIEHIFDQLLANYIDNTEQYEEFLYTMQSMLQDEINFSNNCNLIYLQDLVKQALGINQLIVSTGNHIAPNCKEYKVSYDMDTYAYVSPTMKHPIYFANRDTLIRYIDSNNPGDCHINTYGSSARYFTNTDPNKHIAPNGKIYTIQFSTGSYTSNELTIKKQFSTLNDLRIHIDKHNKPSAIWSHLVDTTFTPQIHLAPNSKEYKIYKTNRGFMSYKLLKVQYFDTLSAIHNYINKNNPK